MFDTLVLCVFVALVYWYDLLEVITSDVWRIIVFVHVICPLFFALYLFARSPENDDPPERVLEMLVSFVVVFLVTGMLLTVMAMQTCKLQTFPVDFLCRYADVVNLIFGVAVSAFISLVVTLFVTFAVCAFREARSHEIGSIP